MRIALIDNGSKLWQQMESLLSAHKVTELSYPESGRALAGGFDAAILTGSSLRRIVPVIEHPDGLREEIRLIQEAPFPVLGVCYGAELAAFAYGAGLKELNAMEEGMREVKLTGNDSLLAGIPPSFSAYEHHHWAVDSLSESLTELARSDDGIEIFRHVTKPVYGFQFHPEKMASEPALTLFQNFLTTVK